MCAVEMDIAIGITTKSDIAMNEFAYYWKFDNITDNRDIYLIVERIDVL